MKNISLIALFCLALASCQKNNSVSPGVADENHSSLAVVNAAASSVTVNTESTLKSAVSAAKAGDIITISGTIKLTSTLQLLNSGTSSSKINLTGGVLDCSGISSGWGVKCNGSYWNITNMTIKNAPDCGLVFQYGGYNYVYNVTTSGNHDSGLQIYNQSHHNNISYCNSNDNYDTQNGGENADGFACKLSAGASNKFDHCTANHNSDDGWDLYGQPSTVTITNCTATNNGYGGNGDGNGFKLGSAGQNVPHTVTNCTSNYNKASGYDGNGNTGHITITGSTGTGNGKALFSRIY
ncbi:right-handed parallel beta-helix repeat-containing protein [Chitinophaga ginsengisoli]|uniref:Parallel beta helix pectate lyase-like protein n=1 Tax=Chitinophaga ginsengisoli TaxID=363837 RepID=A0A2P8FNT4_9BACT|nr:right-handed parallel beta-helix repeat-containing protein [Chitinophaga ginsengisoli]PSL23363.1 parallel beta helix pectate lyase-like protein [Chitinophaga ginsengisoli]